ncbi:MAG: hypothetical protein EOR97_28030 [Mesorhizobium sp.]|uniref:hypothetical protein n=1 Tax=Mesorhizobium sp. TaxID=1871066 RepID=UPI000FE91047|nr:hypothetical protein [Mesorhizobium sp.]RWN26904.1 MAG: hypothetical protein EOR97_28030 [Mesorhizobium sp.]
MTRPTGTDYDHYIADLADIIYASDGVKTLTQAMLERFRDDFKFSVARDTAERRYRKLWRESSAALLVEAAKRADECKFADLKAKADRFLISEAVKLRELAEREPPYSAATAIPITLFVQPATLADYKRNPHVAMLMTFGQFQIAHQRREVLSKLRSKT